MSQKRFSDVIIMYNDVVLHIIIIKHGYILLLKVMEKNVGLS